MNTYKTKHTEPHCSCDCVERREVNEDVQNCLLKVEGGIPVLDIAEEGGSVSIKVRQATSKDRFMAISHVWADGLGNPDQNALPISQLKRLKDLARFSYNQGGTFEQFRDNVYLD